MKKSSVLLMSLLAACALQAGPPAAVFHTSFEQDFTAQTYLAPVDGKHSAEILWENLATYLKPGVENQAAVIGTGSDKKVDYHITFQNDKKYISAEKGSVVFWIKPENWSGTDKHFHMFFRANGKNSDLMIYKVAWTSRLFFVIGSTEKVDGKNIWTAVSADIRDWHPGEWHFVSVVWGNGQASLYVDGLHKGSEKYDGSKVSEFNTFGIGGLRPRDWATPMDYSLIDELMTYNVPLTNEDVLARYGAYKQSKLSARDERAVVPQDIYTGWNQKNDSMELHFSVKYVAPDGKFYQTLVQVADEQGKKIAEETLTPKGTDFSSSVPLSKLAPGKYKFQITVLKKDASLNQAVVVPFAIPKRPEWWRQEKVGNEPTAPAPWTAPKWDSSLRAFSCWNRNYVFGNSLFPEQIVSGKDPLLTRPVGLCMDGKTLSSDGLSVQAKTDERISMSGKGGIADYSAEMKLYGEFDGFFWADLTLTPKTEKASFQKLTLDFPFRKGVAQLFNAMAKQYADYNPGFAGVFQSFNMDLFQAGTKAIFVGTDNAGMEWFCEELSDWNVRGKSQSLQLIPGAKENILRLNLSDSVSKPGKTYRFRFGFQALPVKPLAAKWRLQRANFPGENGFFGFFPWESLHNIPDPNLKAPDFEKRWKNAVATNPKVHWYFAGFTNSPYTDEWSFYGPYWSLTPPAIGTIGSRDSREWAFVRNCAAAPGYIDYYVAGLKNTVEKNGIGNLYFDNQDPQCCDNILHGCGFTGTDGKAWKSYNLLAVRELNKRIYRMFKQIHPEGKIIRHMSMKNVTADTGFADYLVDGENYCTTVGRDESYFNIFNPEMFRALYTTHAYGIPNFYIPQFQRAIRLHSPIKNRYRDAWFSKEHLANHQDKLRHFIGYFLVHDSLIYKSFGVCPESWFAIQDSFGFDGTEQFIQYNAPASPFASKGRRMISCYTLKDKIMIIIMNDEKNPLESISFDENALKKLGVSLNGLKNAENGEPVTWTKNTITIKVPARDYRILVTQPK